MVSQTLQYQLRTSYLLLKIESEPYEEKKQADPRNWTWLQKKCKNSVYTYTAELLFCKIKLLIKNPEDICIFNLKHCLQGF